VYAAFELGKSAQILEYLRMCPKPSKAAVMMALVAAAKQSSLAQVQEALGYVQGAVANESQVGGACVTDRSFCGPSFQTKCSVVAELMRHTPFFFKGGAGVTDCGLTCGAPSRVVGEQCGPFRADGGRGNGTERFSIGKHPRPTCI
jgi:hypothetical protein